MCFPGNSVNPLPREYAKTVSETPATRPGKEPALSHGGWCSLSGPVPAPWPSGAPALELYVSRSIFI